MNSKNKKLIYFTSFLSPVTILFIIFLIVGITPFGGQTLLNGDLYSQYINFFTDLKNFLTKGTLFSFSRGLVTEHLAEFAYYCSSPLNIIILFFNTKTLPAAITLITMIKSGLAGFCMSVYLTKHYNNSRTIPAYTTIIATCYALCSYFICYSDNIIWMDCFYIFPLVILSLEMLVNKRKPYLFTLSLTYAILTNFYIGFMICIFCGVYFIYLLITSDDTFFSKSTLKTLLLFVFHSVISAGLSCVILFPIVEALKITDSGSLSFYNSIFSYYPPSVSVFRHMLDANPTYWHHPYLYSTDLIFILLPTYFLSKKIAVKEKIAKASLCLFMLLSFQINILDFIWNGFHRVNCYAGRQSFIYIFLVLTMLYEVLINSEYNSRYILGACFISLIMFVYINNYFDFTSTMICVLKNMVIVSAYLVIILVLKHNKALPYAIFILMIGEVFYSTYNHITPTISTDEYVNDVDTTLDLIGSIDDSSIYRIKNELKPHNNISSLLGYNSISTYSSLANANIANTLHSLGYPIALNAINDISLEPVCANLFAEKYYITNRELTDEASMELLAESDNTYLYRNNDALSLMYEVPSSIYNSDLTYDNPFENINNLSDKLYGIKNLYTKIDISTKDTIIEKNSRLYVYSKDNFSNAVFKSHKGDEKLYSNSNNTFSLVRNQGDDNYVYYVNTGKYGGTLYISDYDSSKNYCAYILNTDSYDKFINLISPSQLITSEITAHNISGRISCKYDGVIMTSVPYSKNIKIYVDNQEVTTYNWNSLTIFDIKKGEHSISLKYSPASLKYGLIISFISLILLLCSVFFFRLTNINKHTQYCQ